MKADENLSALFMGSPENDWRTKAACRTLDPELFFAADSFENKHEKERREFEAKTVCSTCEVRQECLDYSFLAGERYGIWGGLNAAERRALLRQGDRSRRTQSA